MVTAINNINVMTKTADLTTNFNLKLEWIKTSRDTLLENKDGTQNKSV